MLWNEERFGEDSCDQLRSLAWSGLGLSSGPTCDVDPFLCDAGRFRWMSRFGTGAEPSAGVGRGRADTYSPEEARQIR